MASVDPQSISQALLILNTLNISQDKVHIHQALQVFSSKVPCYEKLASKLSCHLSSFQIKFTPALLSFSIVE